MGFLKQTIQANPGGSRVRWFGFFLSMLPSEQIRYLEIFQDIFHFVGK